MSEAETIIASLRQAILDGDQNASAKAARSGLEAGLDPVELLNKGGTPAIREIGDRFGRFECFLPELILSADAMKAAVDILVVEMRKRGTKSTSKGKVIIGTVEGDVHDIGKNLVAALLAANGFEVVDIGVGVAAKDFVAKAKAEGGDIIALSALMTTSSYFQEQVIQLLKEMGQRDEYFVIVGGGPVTGEWAEKIGADGYGRMASDAVNLCLKLMEAGERQHDAKPLIIG